MWGIYGLVYTAIGVAHAMQGPRRKWRPRIALLIVALGLTAAAHLLAAIAGFTAAVIFMMYLAERRRSYVLQTLIFSAIGALVGGGAGTAGAAMTGNNNDITLPAEAAVSFQLSAPVTLKPAVAPPGTQAQE